jgi:uncharacterized protein
MSGAASTAPPPVSAGLPQRAGGTPPPERPPFLLDFFPLEEAAQTRLARFYEGLREGRLLTTRCAKEGTLTWPPRTVCPSCHSDALDWIDLPRTGTIYAFSAVLVGAPLGMESDVPFAVGLIDLDGAKLRLFGRIVGRPWEELAIGGGVRFEPFELADGRYFYRFRAD